MAGALASGLYGIEKELSLEAQEVVGNAYNFSGAEQLPRDLHTAVSKMKASKLAQTLFGKEFVEHFVMTREWEQQQFASQVTDWELKRYFEII
ncbi:MAG: glutamine synthetase, partial [Cyclobacteriaceae bacterium]|nr:glutamine synthetase [Cyclobacteriaceae bacterium HetDA_MAG_MS6]